MYQFSIVIPCFNSSPYIAATLESIVNQHLGDKIQVVLVDDCSTELFDEVIKPYEETLHIKKVKTEKNLGTGMARQFGIDNADGDWVIFCDHDDFFVPNTFNRVRTIIRNNPSRNIIQTRFQEVTQSGEVIPYSLEKGMNWVHGKFFRRSFLREHDLTFCKGLETHEDIYFSILTRLMTEHLGAPTLNCDLIIYNWVNRPESLSHRRETGLDLFCNHFQDYVTSALGPLDKLHNELSLEEILSQGLSSFLFVYFYVQGFYQLGRGDAKEYRKIMLDCVKKIITYTGFNSQQLESILGQNPATFCMVRQKAFDSVGYFFEVDNIAEIIESAEAELIESKEKELKDGQSKS